MAGASVSVAIDDKELQRFFTKLIQQTDDMTDIFAAIGEQQLESTAQRYKDQKAPDGKKWARLKKKTIAQKSRNADKKLIDSGDLMGTYSYEADSDSLVFGSNRIYAATHQFGDEDRGIVARPHIGISASDELDISNLLAQQLLG